MQMKFVKRMVVAAMTVMVFGSALTVHAEDAVYTVKRGDNLSKIAKEVYGNRKEWKTIYEANKGIIKNANTLYAGQQLVLPGKSAETTQTTQTTTETSTQTTEQNEVTTQQQGENVLGSLNVAVDLKNENNYTILPAEVSVFRPTPFWAHMNWGLPVLPAPDGYEWKEVDIQIKPNTEEWGTTYSNMYELYIEGMDQTWNYSKTWRYGEMDPSMAANWTALDYDSDVMYDQFGFWFEYNGVRYTDCKLLFALEDEDPAAYTHSILMLLPKDYRGSVVYIAYGVKAEDGDIVRNDQETIQIPIQ